MAENRAELVVAARDEASRTFQNVRREIEQLNQTAQSSRGVDDLGATVARTAGGMAAWDAQMAALRGRITGLTTDVQPAVAGIARLEQVVAGLAPVLDRATGGLSGLLHSTALLSGGMTGLIVVGAEVAGAIGGQFVSAIAEAEKRARDFAVTLHGMDIGKITADVHRLRDEIVGLKVDMERRVKGEGTGNALLGFGADLLGLTPKDRDDLFNYFNRQKLGQLTEQQRKELGILSFTERGKGPGATPEDFPATGPSMNAFREQQAKRTLDLEQAQRGLFDFQMQAIQAELEQARRQASDLRRENQPEAAAKLLGAAEERYRFRYAGEILPRQMMQDIGSTAGLEQITIGPTLNELAAGRGRSEREFFARFRDQLTRDVAESGTAGFEQTGLGPSPAEDRAGRARGLAELREAATLKAQLRDLDRATLEVQLERSTLTDRERDSLQELASGRRELAELARLEDQIAVAQAAHRLDVVDALEQEKAAVTAIAEVRRQIRAESIIERDHPLAGALRGLEDFEGQAARAGERMRSAMFGAMSDVGNGITDILVAGISGEEDRIGDIGKRLGQALMRGLLQELVVTPLVSQLSQGLRTGLQNLPGFGTAAAGGGGIAALFGGLGPTAAQAAQSVVGTAPNAPVGSIIQTVAGAGVVTASGSVALIGGSAAALPSGGADLLVAQAGAGASPFGGSLSALPTSSQMAVGATPGLTASLVGGAAGAAAVGFTAYSAYQTAQTTQDVAFAGVTGALAGAAAGASIGGYYDSSGYGALIGAVAGAAISAGAAAYGKAKNQPKKAEREKQEAGEWAAAFQAMFTDLDAAQTPEELYAVVKRYTHAGAGGERSGNSAAEAGLVVTVDCAGIRKRVIDGGVTPAELVQYGATAQVQIIAGVSDDAKRPFEERLASAIRQAAARIRTLGDQVRVFFEETLGGGITRTTVLAYARLAEAAGQDISVVAATLNGLDPTARQKILERIAVQDINGALDLYAVESSLAQKVKVGEFLKAAAVQAGTPPGPGGGAPGEPAPELTPEEVARLEQIAQDIKNAAGSSGPDVSDPSTGPADTGGPSVSGLISGLISGTPVGLAGQGAAAIAVRAGMSQENANILGNAVNLGFSVPGLGPIGVLAGALNTGLGLISLAIQGQNVFANLLSAITGAGTTSNLTQAQAIAALGELGLVATPVDIAQLTGMAPPGFAVFSTPQGYVAMQTATIDPNTGQLVAFGAATGNAPPGSTNFGTGAGNTTGGSPGGGPGGPGVGPGGVGGPGGEGGQEAGQYGGWVPGEGRGDIVPAIIGGTKPFRLEPQEFIVNREAAAEHARELEEINRFRPGRNPRPKAGMSDEDLIALLQRLSRVDRKYGLRAFNDSDQHRPATGWSF